MVPDRSTKAQRTAAGTDNRFGSPDASIKHFVEERDDGKFLKHTTACAIRRDSPLGKSGWLRVYSAHRVTANGTRSRSMK